jgi:hypothetical protein
VRPLRVAAALLAVMLAAPAVDGARDAAAQQTPPPPDTVLTPEQRALERLRALGAVSQPDTLEVPVDTVRTQQFRVAGGAAPQRMERDSVMERLLGVAGYIVTEYSGATARFQADSSVLELRGSPQVAREGSQLVADTAGVIVYDERLGRACGYGQPVLHAAGMTNPLVSDTVCFDVVRQVGYAKGAQTTIAEGATWNLRGDVYFQGDDFYSHRAVFTDCDLPWPHVHYHFGAREVKVVRDNVLVARDVTLNFADVPVFWLPFMVQSLAEGRRSGILMPRFGINDIARSNARYSRRIEDVGVYWAINDYMGSELAMDWFADNWTAVRGSLDYNFAHHFVRGGLTYRRFWKQEGGRDFTIASQNSWQMDERTSVNVSANYATSTSFVRQRTFDPRELNRSIDSNASLRRRFDWGSLSLGATRRQFLSDNTVNMQLPNLGLSFSPITLFEALPGQERWYSNASWQGSVDLRMDRQDIGDANVNPRAQSRRQLTTGARSGLSVGRFSWNQNFSLDDQVRYERLLPGDTVLLEGSAEQRGRWSSSLNFQQRLIGNSTFTPGLSLGGEFLRSDRTDDELVMAPTRVDFNAAVRTELYGFWPGVGPFERFRHRLSPSFSYSYAPEVTADSLQRAVFQGGGGAEQNRLSIGLTQTFEGRPRAVVQEGRGGAAADTAAAGTAAAEVAATGDQAGPRRREQTQPVNLLSISTDAIVYDFVSARDGDGIVTTQIGNSIQSDLLRGLQLSFAHDLFRMPEPDEDGERGPREFAPHLSRVNASFSVNANSWLFRVLRLGSASATPETGGMPPMEGGEQPGAGPALTRTESEYGMVGTSRRGGVQGPRGPTGSWNASVNYTLFRPRDDGRGGQENQMATANFSFQPTEQWSVHWNTGYSMTTKAFTDHVLTLSRALHDWDANFDFVKAQNGNFSFQFRVHLRANPDIKVDYSQSDVAGLRDGPGRIR